MNFRGARAHSVIEGAQPLAGKSNYFIGSDPANWRRDIPQFGAVRYRDVYPGIDLVFHASSQTIEYDWIVSPGADPASIRVSFQGAAETRIDNTGDLLLRVGDVEIREKRPHVYQDVGQDGARQIDAKFVRQGRFIGFKVAKFDHFRPLIIDPVLTYATILGGNGNALNQAGDNGEKVVMDAQGNAIVIGYTASQTFPTKNGAFVDGGAIFNAFVTKLNPNGAVGSASLIWSTYLGGTQGSTQGYGITLDSSGNVYVAGISEAQDFPLKNAFQGPAGATSTCINAEGGRGICFLSFVTSSTRQETH